MKFGISVVAPVSAFSGARASVGQESRPVESELSFCPSLAPSSVCACLYMAENEKKKRSPCPFPIFIQVLTDMNTRTRAFVDIVAGLRNHRLPPPSQLPFSTSGLVVPCVAATFCHHQAEAVFTIGEAFRGDHKAALAALSATTTLQFEYLDALLRPGSHGMSLTASNAAEASSDARKGKVWGESRNRSASAVATPSSSSKPLPGLAAGLDDGDRALHVRLLIRFRPYEVYPFLSSSTG